MGELVYKEWLPLSEADKSATQVVRVTEPHLRHHPIRTAVHSKGKWRAQSNFDLCFNEAVFEFLCLTPATSIEE